MSREKIIQAGQTPGKTRIDLVMEKYLTSLKRWGDTLDIFVNPSRDELKDIIDKKRGYSVRFIADSKKKNIYFFPTQLLHQEAWNEYISKEINDSRKMYKTETLFGGTIEGGEVYNWGVGDELYNGKHIEMWINNPEAFAFCSKWAKVQEWIEDNQQYLEEHVDDRGI